VMTSLLYIGQFYIERYFGRGASRSIAETPIQKIRRNLSRLRFRQRPQGGGA
jgi:polar amino acid transport system permease protein